MNDVLERLLYTAKTDKNIRSELLKTRQSADPMGEFCKKATALGFPVSIGELMTMGEEMNCQQLKSTNGGGVTPYFGFDDPYEMFFTELELYMRFKKD